MPHFTFKEEKSNHLSHLAVMGGTMKFDMLNQNHQGVG